MKLDERRDRAFYREWVDLTDEQFDQIGHKTVERILKL